ncbi:LysM-like peptidoglycan-binding domain-containing protein [Aeromonas schubertii]|uniref:LysM-like peptidoglycan-binding domain-containing protein n=1 Tax=Aeromonas schubertii TaxID=652 RepID=UPI0010A8CDFC|nr:LysM-like peptidoglycan-binding domain-containing protein [Aeromonas schubertii]QCG47024.1 opacity-associated protein A [Aeromonas schubertii]
MPTPDRRPRGQHRRARAGRQPDSNLLQRVQLKIQEWKEARANAGARTDAARPKRSAGDDGKKHLIVTGRLPRRHTIALALLVPLWLLLLAWQPSDELPAQNAPSGSLAVPIAVPVQAQQTASGQPIQPKPKAVEKLPAGWNWLTHEVDAGETLFAVFRKFQLPGAELSRLVAIEGPDRPLTRLQAGKSVYVLLDADRRIQRVEIRDKGEPIYRYVRENEGFIQKEIGNP